MDKDSKFIAMIKNAKVGDTIMYPSDTEYDSYTYYKRSEQETKILEETAKDIDFRNCQCCRNKLKMVRDENRVVAWKSFIMYCSILLMMIKCLFR